MTPEVATARLHHAPNPVVERVGPLYTCTSAVIIYPVVVSNQPEYVSEKFRSTATPELVREGYNNLICLYGDTAVLQYEW